MKAIDTLMAEHRLIERVLDALEAATVRLERGEAVPPSFFASCADFVAGFADGCHHHKEEGLLFPALLAAGLPAENGPVAVMLAEHEQGRLHTRAMRAAAARLADGEEAASQDLVLAARAYAALLRQHIAKEDQVLFPMAVDLLPASAQARLLSDFAQAEEAETALGTLAAYEAQAEALRAQAL